MRTAKQYNALQVGEYSFIPNDSTAEGQPETPETEQLKILLKNAAEVLKECAETFKVFSDHCINGRVVFKKLNRILKEIKNYEKTE